jgi:hypothetical protein
VGLRGDDVVQPTRQPGRALLYGPVWGPGRNDWFGSKQASLSSPTRTSHIHSSTCRYITPREVKCVSVVGLLRAHCSMRGSVGDGWEVARIRVRVIKSRKDRSDSRISSWIGRASWRFCLSKHSWHTLEQLPISFTIRFYSLCLFGLTRHLANAKCVPKRLGVVSDGVGARARVWRKT